jgi:hypothetical protein
MMRMAHPSMEPKATAHARPFRERSMNPVTSATTAAAHHPIIQVAAATMTAIST